MVETGLAIKNEMSSLSAASRFRGDGEDYEDAPGRIFGHSQWQADERKSNVDNLYGTLSSSFSSSEEVENAWRDYDGGGHSGSSAINNVSSLFVGSGEGQERDISPWGRSTGFNETMWPTSRFGEDGYSTTTAIPSLMLGIGEENSGEDPTWATWVLVTLFTSLIVVTIIGNVLVCLSVILVRKLRKPQNYLLVSLAISDLFVAIFVMPFAVALEVSGGAWPFNNALCDLWVSADVLCCTASILNLCGISVDRYRAITTPLEYSSKATPRRMLAMVFFVWLGSACVSLPPVLLLGNVHQDSHGIPFCSVSQNFWYQIYATMASFYVPLCVMVVVYVKILRVVADKKKQMGWKPASAPTHKSIHRNTSASIATNYTSTASLRGSTSVGVATSLVSTCPTGGSGGSSMITPSSTPAHHPHQHPLVTRALVTNSVGGSPVTITTIVSGSSATSSPIRRGSFTRAVEDSGETTHAVSNNTNNNKKDSTASQNTAVTTPLLMKTNGGVVGSGSPVKNHKYNSNNNKKNRRSRHQERVDSRNSINLQQHSQQNGTHGNAVTYFFSTGAIHRIKKEKLFGGLKEHKASTTLGIIMSAFVICWLPFFVLALIRPFLTINNIEIPPWMYTLFNWLGYANSALNPVIYATLNRDFRKPFREILCLRCSTLDDMMRREFYHQQYGDDVENYNRRISRPATDIEPMSTVDGPTVV